MSALLMTLTVFLAALQEVPNPLPDEAHPRVWHVGSYASELGARWTADGLLDTGGAQAQVFDGTSGLPLEPRRFDFGPGPTLGVRWRGQLGELKLTGFLLSGEVTRNGDRRLTTAQQIALHNPTDAPVRGVLEVRVRPGPDDDAGRPWPSRGHQPDETWALDGDAVLRDGRATVGWVGTPPAVEVLAPDGPFGVAVRLIYDITVPPGAEARLEFKLAGPPAGDTVDEPAWRRRFSASTWGVFEDKRRWETTYRGQFGGLISADERFRSGMVTAIHVLRAFGRAKGDIERLSDRAFGHPASDAAAEAEVLGLFLEFGFHDICAAYLDLLLEELYERAGDLSLERKLAYLHGLARGVRLSADADRDPILAEAIVALLDGGGPEGWSEPWEDGAVAVRPWQDPERVRQDLAAVLERAGVERDQPLPRLAWPEVPADQPALTHMQAVMRALAAGDGDAAWAHYSALSDRLTKWGAGSSTDRGQVDAAFALGLCSVGRALLIDDHGDDLVLFPGSAEGMLTDAVSCETAWMPTRFGLVKAQIFHTGARLVGGWVQRKGVREAARMLMDFPDHITLRRQKSIVGGEVEIVDADTAEFRIVKPAHRGVRFLLRANKGDDAGDDEPEDDGDSATGG